jgi:putative ATP-dependent endonuclease of OLD family
VQLTSLRLKNFQSFGPEPTTLALDAMTYLLGPNGSGKTSVLTALARMFAIDPQMRRVQRSDFHIPSAGALNAEPEDQTLWIEVDFEFPELESGTTTYSVPSFFSHMRINTDDDAPRVRIRLTAATDPNPTDLRP